MVLRKPRERERERKRERERGRGRGRETERDCGKWFKISPKIQTRHSVAYLSEN